MEDHQEEGEADHRVEEYLQETLMEEQQQQLVEQNTNNSAIL